MGAGGVAGTGVIVIEFIPIGGGLEGARDAEVIIGEAAVDKFRHVEEWSAEFDLADDLFGEFVDFNIGQCVDAKPGICGLRGGGLGAVSWPRKIRPAAKL